ncbi:hypothetical protein L6164_016034 [Bauhinia variegata]|uniref:Uncharacterized protein n=1 Tax=Bauhinia variegata TaxID=167791 RepID=A0ACB9NME1_BAUVA|nr:hypothetical protein L6164_016034 [Bauhinia variegata]
MMPMSSEIDNLLPWSTQLRRTGIGFPMEGFIPRISFCAIDSSVALNGEARQDTGLLKLDAINKRLVLRNINIHFQCRERNRETERSLPSQTSEKEVVCHSNGKQLSAVKSVSVVCTVYLSL